MFKYSINLNWSDEDNCYVATISEFPGLSAHGDTPEEAASEARMAAEGFIAVYEEDGCVIPEPETHQPFSGQTRLRLPKSLHAALSRSAKREGVSLNSYIVRLLSERNLAMKLQNDVSAIKSLTRLIALAQSVKPVKSGTEDLNTWDVGEYNIGDVNILPFVRHNQ